jgi:hypothetical protein
MPAPAASAPQEEEHANTSAARYRYCASLRSSAAKPHTSRLLRKMEQGYRLARLQDIRFATYRSKDAVAVSSFMLRACGSKQADVDLRHADPPTRHHLLA